MFCWVSAVGSCRETCGVAGVVVLHVVIHFVDEINDCETGTINKDSFEGGIIGIYIKLRLEIE